MKALTDVRRISVLGAGSWGTALAIHLARKGLDVYLWGPNQAHMAAMSSARQNARYLADITWPTTLQCGSNLAEALRFSEIVLVVVPSHVFRDVLRQVQPYWTAAHGLIWASKGVDPLANQLLHEVAVQELGPMSLMAVLSGPNFAREVAQALPAATTIACQQAEHVDAVCQIFKAETLRVYASLDVIGVEVGGAVKNVVAIAVGLCDGLQLGANARAALITRGLAEITRLGLAMGGLAETFVGMAGMGDLLLTCTDNQSRNRRFGLMVGQGEPMVDAFAHIGQVVEGYHNVKQVLALAQQHHVSMPITEQVYKICYENFDPRRAAAELLRR